MNISLPKNKNEDTLKDINIYDEKTMRKIMVSRLVCGKEDQGLTSLGKEYEYSLVQ